MKVKSRVLTRYGPRSPYALPQDVAGGQMVDGTAGSQGIGVLQPLAAGRLYLPARATTLPL